MELDNSSDVRCVPECPDELKPVVGKKFKTLEDGISFYDGYARVAGFDTRKQGNKAVRDQVTWQYLVCNRQGVRKVDYTDQRNAREDFVNKRRRLSKRCVCPAKLTLKFASEGGCSSYVVNDFVEEHNHVMIIMPHRRYMNLNRKLTEVHKKFIWDCTKANIGPTMTFKFLKEFLGGYDTVGLTVTEIRNAVTGMKVYVEGTDAQMLLDEMRRKKASSDAFSFHYELETDNSLKCLFWCDAACKRNYHMYGDVVAFDSTYNTNRYCMIFSPFTGKDNHGKPVTFGAALLSSEGTEMYSWVFKCFVESMGKYPRMIVTDQDRGMKSAIEKVFVGTRHRWCMWHIMLKLSDKVPKKMLDSDELKKEIKSCVWSETIEPQEFEETWLGIMERYGLEDVEWFKTMYDHRARWVPAFFRDFPMGSMIRTTSVSESENSFYKTFTKPRANLVEFIMSFDHALEAQRNASSRLDYLDSTGVPILATELSFEKQSSTMYTDHIFRRVQKEIVDACFHCPIDAIVKDEFSETYTMKDLYGKKWTVTYEKEGDTYECGCKLFIREGFFCCHIFSVLKNRDVKLIPEMHYNGRWLKTSLAKSVHGQVDMDSGPTVVADPKQLAVNKMYEVILGFARKFEAKIETAFAFTEGVVELGKSIESDFPILSIAEKKSLVEEFYGRPRPIEIEVHPPKVVKTKGSCSRLVSRKEAAIKKLSKPQRRCAKCNELGYHDSRNCDSQSKGKGKEKV